jgi:hypothetical protein
MTMPLPPRIPRLPSRIASAVRAMATKETKRAMPSPKGGEQQTLQTYRTEVYSYFTVPSAESQLFYSAENWVRIKLTLETAGPVSVGTSANVSPVLSGHGRLLDTGVEYECFLAQGSRFYISSESVNRISVTVEPIPWMEQLSGEIVATARAVSNAVTAVGAAIVAAIGELRGIPAPASSTGVATKDMPLPKLPLSLAARLTRVRPPKRVR